jgi:uncharacterized protein (TIGR02646 family)
MIRRPRPPKSCPASLDPSDKSSSGYKEFQLVEQWYASLTSAQPGERPKFKAYKGKDVVKTLGDLFDYKCAYCESRYAITQPVDVEHWRPKARIEGVPHHTGYSWLAMKWENLLPSCIDCNRARKQEVPNAGSKKPWIQRKVGKADQFPIVKPSLRWTFDNSQQPEEPLLLDPCTDDPDDYFEFHKSGVILPKKKITKKQLDRALKSIEVYALNRKALVDERLRHMLRLEPIFKLVRFLFTASGDTSLPSQFRTSASSLVAETLSRLQESCAANMPYSQFVKRRLERFLRDELGAS